jgi:hypothetical protein
MGDPDDPENGAVRRKSCYAATVYFITHVYREGSS